MEQVELLHKIEQLHKEAMDYAERAFILKLSGNLEEFNAVTLSAFESEKAAADLSKDLSENEVTRAVLHRSAASLALECKKIREAEQLIGRALSWDPPEEIAEELRNLLEEVHFDRHLALRGEVLSESEVQLSVAGSAVGFGRAPGRLVLDRVRATETLLIRTIERKLNKPFRTAGAPEKSITDSFELYLSVPRAASFAITMRLGQPVTQESIFPTELPQLTAIDEVLDCIELFNNKEDDKLKSRISDPVYYNNFVALAKTMAPDGDSLNLVGLTSTANNKTRAVKLTRRSSEVLSHDIDAVAISAEPIKRVILTGKLNAASNKKPSSPNINLECVVEGKMVNYTIIVPEGTMNDIVKPLWDEVVEISGIEEAKHKVKMIDIKKA